MKRIILILILASFSLLLGISFALAKNVSLEPARLRLLIAPGGIKNGIVKIDNPSAQEIKVRVYLEDWLYNSYTDGTKEFLPPGTTSFSCSCWIDFSPAEFTIHAFGRQVVNYNVRLPEDASGGYFCVMFFETDIVDAKDNLESAVKLKARLGTLFSIETEGKIRCEAELQNIKVKKEQGFLRIGANFKNTGNTDIAPKITFHIIDMQGNVFSRGKFGGIFTLPKDEGEIIAEAKENLSPGNYTLVITMNLGRGLPKVLEVPIKVDKS